MSLVIRELNINDEVAFLEAVNDWKPEELSWHTFDWKPEINFKDHLERLKKNKQGIELTNNHVPSTMLYGFLECRIVGRLSLRHSLNDFLLTRGGHIGYAVALPFRNKGYATQLLNAGIKEAQNIGLNKILMTCSENNNASKKMISNTGANLENKIFDENEKSDILRFWLNI